MRDTELYRLVPTKGFMRDNLRYIAIDAVRDCVGKRCPVHDQCPYAKSGKCTVERNYLEAVMDSFYDIVGKALNQELLNAFTLRMLPLFHQLVRFQIFAYSVEDVFYETARGLIKPHPVFKEIRETIKAIESTQKSIGIDGEYIHALDLLKRPAALPSTEVVEGTAGSPNWRDQWNKENFGEGLGLRDAESQPKLRRAVK
jgi:hypothetical protein